MRSGCASPAPSMTLTSRSVRPSALWSCWKSSATLRDWCRFSLTQTAFIDPGAPWQNGFVESFHARVRDELLNVEQFACLAEAQVVIGDWREHYNTCRPHSALGMRTPTAFAAAWATADTEAA